MPHNFSYFLGLQVHDVGGNQADISGTLIDSNEPKHKMRRVIEANQVLTVELGIYFIDILLKSLFQNDRGSDQPPLIWLENNTKLFPQKEST